MAFTFAGLEASEKTEPIKGVEQRPTRETQPITFELRRPHFKTTLARPTRWTRAVRILIFLSILCDSYVSRSAFCLIPIFFLMEGKANHLRKSKYVCWQLLRDQPKLLTRLNEREKLSNKQLISVKHDKKTSSINFECKVRDNNWFH